MGCSRCARRFRVWLTIDQVKINSLTCKVIVLPVAVRHPEPITQCHGAIQLTLTTRTNILKYASLGLIGFAVLNFLALFPFLQPVMEKGRFFKPGAV